jgi:hypothetical protein
MAASLGKFQVFESQSWSGLTTKNHLGAIYRAAPQKASNIITKLLAFNYAPTLDTMLSKFPVKYFDTDDEFTWDLIGSMERNYPLVEARVNGVVVLTGDTNVGAGQEKIDLVFAERCFHDVNVIVGEKNEIYPLRVLADPTPEGTNWVYSVELMGAVINGMPGSELIAGKRFSKDFSPVEDTMSIKGGDISFNSPIALRNEFSAIRMQHTAPGNMKARPLVLPFEFVNPKTNKVEMSSTWMEHVEWKFEYEFAMEKSRLLMFARTNRDQNGDYYNIGKSGHVIKMGSGIREQMEVSNTVYYNEFSIRLLTNMLTELSEGKLSMDERHFVLRTGERGAVQFHEAVKADVSGWLPLGFDNSGTGAIQKVASPLNSNAYSAGFQFVQWLAPNGIKVTLEVDPFYDDKVRNKILHPKGGVAESYRYDILDIGTMDGEPNIQKAMVKGQEDIRKWEYGLRNPFPSAPEFAIISNSVDGSTYHRASMGLGAIVRDPSRTASLIPSILAA